MDKNNTYQSNNFININNKNYIIKNEDDYKYTSESDIYINLSKKLTESEIKYNSDDEHKYDGDDENYIIKTNICKNLSNELGLSETNYDNEDFSWEPPSTHGLQNCDYIIPPYYKYHTNIKKIFDIDYFDIIKDDIRNFRKLNKYQLKYIKELSHEYKDELFDIYNECIHTINDIL